MQAYDNAFMLLAIDEACRGVQCGNGGPFGAVVVRDGAIIAAGHNMVLTNKDPTAHAEVTVIRAACAALNCFDLSGCALYTSCYPCPMCLGACLWARLDAIYYASTAEQAAAVGFDDRVFHDFVKDPKSGQLLKLEHFVCDEHAKPFEMWTAREKKTRY